MIRGTHALLLQLLLLDGVGNKPALFPHAEMNPTSLDCCVITSTPQLPQNRYKPGGVRFNGLESSIVIIILQLSIVNLNIFFVKKETTTKL